MKYYFYFIFFLCLPAAILCTDNSGNKNTADYYAILCTTPDASPQDIRKSYLRLSKQYHPDKKGGNENLMKQITGAYQVLSDPERHTQYDRERNPPTTLELIANFLCLCKNRN